MLTEFVNINLASVVTSNKKTWSEGWKERSTVLADFIEDYGCNDTFFVKVTDGLDAPLITLVEVGDSLVRYQAYRWLMTRGIHDGKFVAAVIPESSRVGQFH